MIITTNNPKAVALKRVWDSAGERSEGLGNGLRRVLVRDVLAPAVEEFNGELILKYQEFLTRVPSGRHSFARGSEMISKTVYRVSVARIAGREIEEVPKIPPPNSMSFATLSKVLIPVRWEIYLKPQYCKGANFPHFVPVETAELNEGKFDLALLGHHLFRTSRGDLDWATKIEIAVGNESVSAWLRERKSALAYNTLKRR